MMKICSACPALLATILLAGCSGTDPVAAAATAGDAQHESHDEHADHGSSAAGHVELGVEAAKAAGIELDAAGPAAVRELLPLYGAVQPNAERVREVTARFPGLIQAVRKQAGDAVDRGETLATIESNESLTIYAVTSPLAGVVTSRHANPGENAGDAALFTVADLSEVWAELSLFPRDLAKVRKGQRVRIRAADESQTSEGRISYLAPLGQAGSQTLVARVPIDNRDRRWAPGLYVTGEVALSEIEAPVAVRSSALQTLGNDTVVFIVDGDGFKAQPVVPGRADGEHTEIRSGLAAGTRYAAANSFVLKSELGKGEAGHEH
jgi:cobalt-zinc-cadmium efflux system membrane fusion protein